MTYIWWGATAPTSTVYWNNTGGVTKSSSKLLDNGGPYYQRSVVTDTGQSPVTTFYYRVACSNEYHEGDLSKEISTTVQTLCDPPTFLGAATAKINNATVISWNSVGGATGYNLYWKYDWTGGTR